MLKISLVHCSLGLIPAVTPLLLSNNLNGSTVACSGQQITYECLANSPELFWSSPEYIGPTGVRIEFSGSIDNVGAERRAGNAVATLLGLHGRNVTSSELVITASQDFPTASVTCDDGIQPVTSILKVPGMFYVAKQSVYCLSTEHCCDDEATPTCSLYQKSEGVQQGQKVIVNCV